MTDLLDSHTRASNEFGQRVHLVADDQWANATPCTDWDVRTLVNHLVQEQLWVPLLVGGWRIAEVGNRFEGDQLDAHPRSVWDSAAARAHEAFAADGALERDVHLSYGDSPADAYCREMISDLVIHAWDLARGIGADESLDGGLVADVYAWTEPHADELAGTGLFAPPVPTAGGATLQTRMLAMYGRQV